MSKHGLRPETLRGPAREQCQSSVAFEVDPISIRAAAPDNFIEIISNNSDSAAGNVVEIKGESDSQK